MKKIKDKYYFYTDEFINYVNERATGKIEEGW